MKRLRIIYVLAALVGAFLGAGKAAGQQPPTWNGVWSVSTRFAPATLTIKPLTKTKFKFTIESMNGANMGEISGVAKINGSRAFFNDRESTGKASDERTDCRLTFTKRGKIIKVEQTFECQRFAGLGVFFGGDYEKGKIKKQIDTLFSMEILPSAKIDRRLKLLVGSDYEKFVDSFQLRSDDERDTELNASIVSGCVRGICPWNAAIVVFDAQGNLWASVIHIDKQEKVFALYYSNVAEWVGKLPKSIENWINEKRESSEDLKIVYKNQK